MIIANATPLIYLHRIGQLECLHQLFTQVAILEEEAFLIISMRTTRPFVFHADCFVAISKVVT
jgi:predicted nucleic acid-binding protein